MAASSVATPVAAAGALVPLSPPVDVSSLWPLLLTFIKQNDGIGLYEALHEIHGKVDVSKIAAPASAVSPPASLLHEAILHGHKGCVVVLIHFGFPLPANPSLSRKHKSAYAPLLTDRSKASSLISRQGALKVVDEDISGMGVYTGTIWFDGLRHGSGVLENPPLYKRGHWVKDKFHRGKARVREGENIYDGTYDNGLKHGSGLMLFANGDSYDGAWVNGHRHGKGTMKFHTGDFYTGEWEKDKRHGEGTMIYTNGDFELGRWESDKFAEGKAKRMFDNGEFYEGDWEYFGRHGEGLLRYPNGDVYAGQFDHNQRSGKGYLRKLAIVGNISEVRAELQKAAVAAVSGAVELSNAVDVVPARTALVMAGLHTDGEYQDGLWEEDQFLAGKVRVKYPNGSHYEGESAMGKRHGKGILVAAHTRDVYEGEFSLDKRHGKGVERFWESQGSFEGVWQQDNRHGCGTFTWPDGQQSVWVYVEGKKVAEKEKPDSYKSSAEVFASLQQVQEELKQLRIDKEKAEEMYRDIIDLAHSKITDTGTSIDEFKLNIATLESQMNELIREKAFMLVECHQLMDQLKTVSDSLDVVETEKKTIASELRHHREMAEQFSTTKDSLLKQVGALEKKNEASERENALLEQNYAELKKQATEGLETLKEQVFKIAKQEYHQQIMALKAEMQAEVKERMEKMISETGKQVEVLQAKIDVHVSEISSLAKEREDLSQCVQALKKESTELQAKYDKAMREYGQLCGRGIEGLSLDQLTHLSQILKTSKSKLQAQREATVQKKLKEQEEKLSRITDEKDRDVTCIVCLDKPRATICEPCKHFATCVACAEKLWEKRRVETVLCPVCRQKINGKPKQIYWP